MGRGQRYGHGDRVWINRGGGLTEGTIIEVLGETEYLVAVDGQGVTEIQERHSAPRGYRPPRARTAGRLAPS